LVPGTGISASDTGLQVSFTGSAILGLDVGKADVAAEQLLLLGQLTDGVGGEDILEKGGLSGQDGDHLLSAKVGCCWD
jgi:hypothetical protein